MGDVDDVMVSDGVGVVDAVTEADADTLSEVEKSCVIDMDTVGVTDSLPLFEYVSSSDTVKVGEPVSDRDRDCFKVRVLVGRGVLDRVGPFELVNDWEGVGV